ncbi:hypothetical protein AZSI13_10280 [Azospira sp. I13]|uniref:DUF4062 domain-containing protein n=1 Tax=Azospira sp. I13 TaxID=1765050 RepID=UPI000D4663ED|nr:DUF4062 domain-containing protein [Azospira sp. I13]GBG01701.1 hypothetical protein AZSI13_10280 [Azospira sp. I13]
MPEKRFQVFVSSTFRDLEDERQEVMHALLELDCMPAGMELFPAANESQWNLIKRVIDDCDYYILILGGRYGSIGPEGFSYTEMEYRYALDTGKPIISFLHRNPGQIVADKSEQSQEGRERLAAFRALVEQRLCKHWESAADLGSVVSRSLIQLIKSAPGIGWVRANELPDKDAMSELLRLRRQVDELQVELAKSRITAPKGAENLSQGTDSHELNCLVTTRQPSHSGYGDKDWSYSQDLTWNDIFSSVAPLMIHEAPEAQLKKALDSLVQEKLGPVVANEREFVGRKIIRITLDDQDFQTVKIQLRALGLMAKSEKARSVKDSGTYWTLTPYGDEVMTRLRAIRKAPPSPHNPLEGVGANVN